MITLRHLMFTTIPLVATATVAGGLIVRGVRPGAPVAPLPIAPVVDLHCHLAGIGAGGSGCFISERLRRSLRFGFYLRSFGVTRADLAAQGDGLIADRIAAGLAGSRLVRQAVVLALDGVVDEHGELDRARTECYVPDEFVAAEVARHRELLFGASVNPYRPDALARLEWAKAHGAVLVKWLPSVQLIDPADERLVPYYRKLVELDLPLLTHTGSERSFTRARDALADPARLELPLRLGVVVIAAHAGGSGRFAGEASTARLARLMRQHANLHADLSALTQFNHARILADVLARPEMRGRLLYGSDYPLSAIRTLVSPWWFPLRLTFSQMRGIAAIANPWDRDVALKQALGVPADAWTHAERLLRLPPIPIR
jgi:predicted TIM-barrel fold metal-dependent hydrolase